MAGARVFVSVLSGRMSYRGCAIVLILLLTAGFMLSVRLLPCSSPQQDSHVIAAITSPVVNGHVREFFNTPMQSLFPVPNDAPFGRRVISHDDRTISEVLDAATAAVRPQCTVHCNVWREAILHFLRPYFSLELRRRFTATTFMSEIERLTPHLRSPHPVIAAVVVKGGKVYVARSVATREMHPWLYWMLITLVDAAALMPLPDSYFFLSTSDWPHLHRSADPHLLLLSVNTGDNHWDIPVPGGQFTGDYDAVAVQTVDALDDMPWLKRQPVAMWRGTVMCEDAAACETRCSRLTLRRVSQLYPSLIDFRFTHVPKEIEAEACPFQIAGALMANDTSVNLRLSRSDQLSFRFQIAADGHSYASGYKYFLLSGSTVLRQRTNFIEFFDPALQPWVHYVPFDCRSVNDCDIVPLVQQHVEDDNKLKRRVYTQNTAERVRVLESIGAASHAFAHTHLAPMGRWCYWHVLLRAVETLFADTGLDAINDDWVTQNTVCLSCTSKPEAVQAWVPPNHTVLRRDAGR